MKADSRNQRDQRNQPNHRCYSSSQGQQTLPSRDSLKCSCLAAIACWQTDVGNVGSGTGILRVEHRRPISTAPIAFGNIWKYNEIHGTPIGTSIGTLIQRNDFGIPSFYSAVLMDQSVVSSPNRSYNRWPGITPIAKRNKTNMLIGNTSVFGRFFPQ